MRCPMDGRWSEHTIELSLYNDIGEMSASILTITGVIVSMNGHGWGFSAVDGVLPCPWP